MPVNLDLPDILRDHDDVTYTARQLEPTIARLQDAVEDLGGPKPTPQALAAAWTRIAELRLPRKAVPGPVLSAIEDLVVAWGEHKIGGIAGYAYSLKPEALEREGERIRDMLTNAQAAATSAPPGPVFLTE
ncbi:MAG: hypothetical protein CL897_04010 [Dehalococcoidia bacterium]|nr:hypothetical protein [Dehalococcoidia bacterium]HCV00908.1 hypothetical protein [Dehalococcoidia bacterium]|tara:strand:- start:1698 stop:2090 length:393 start_codon:yes stop_codon:yes gene_type:complete